MMVKSSTIDHRLYSEEQHELWDNLILQSSAKARQAWVESLIDAGDLSPLEQVSDHGEFMF